MKEFDYVNCLAVKREKAKGTFNSTDYQMAFGK